MGSRKLHIDKRILENLIKVTPDNLELYFKLRPESLDEKRGTELLTGLLLSRTFEKLDGRSHEIFIPIKKRTSEPPNLDEIINNPALHLDSDIDLYIGENEKEASKIQITEFEEHYLGETLDDGLINRIKSKCRRSPDPNLHLAVIANVNGVINFERIGEGIERFSCPYAHIFYVGQFGSSIKLGKFSCHMLYPQLREPVKIQLNWKGN